MRTQIIEILQKKYPEYCMQHIDTADEILNLFDVRLSLNNDIYECLRELCQLKTYKDEQGKDEFYETKQPKLWEQANKLIDKYNEA